MSGDNDLIPVMLPRSYVQSRAAQAATFPEALRLACVDALRERQHHRFSLLHMTQDRGMWLFCSCGTVVAEYTKSVTLDRIGTDASKHSSDVIVFDDGPDFDPLHPPIDLLTRPSTDTPRTRP